jgi:hypothetical protein
MKKRIKRLERAIKPTIDLSTKGLLAFHPKFIEFQESIYNTICEDCRSEIKSKFSEYLEDVKHLEKELRQLALQADPRALKWHVDEVEFIRICASALNRHRSCREAVIKTLEVD